MESHDSLPHIDRTPTEAELASARSLLSTSLDDTASSTLHPSISTSYGPSFSDLVTTAHDSVSSTGKARTPGTGIDLSRYEEPTAPSISDDTSSPERRMQWSQALRQAYTSHAYLSGRHMNLALLERYGKNAWLVGNSQVEEELKALEKELAEVRRQSEEVDEQRRRAQETVSGELEGLGEAWRNGVGRAIEAEVAGESLRREILERSRKAG